MSANEFARGGGGGGGSSGPEIIDIEFPDGVTTVSETVQGFDGEGITAVELDFTTTAEVDPEGNELRLEYRTDGQVGLTVFDAIRNILGRDVSEPFNVVANIDQSDFGPILDVASDAQDLTVIDDPLTRQAVQRTIDQFPILSRGRTAFRDITNINQRAINTQISSAETFDPPSLPFDLPFDLPGGGEVLIGDDPATVNISAPFQPIIIPDIPAIRDNIDLDQTVSFVFRLRTTNFFDSVIEGRIFETPEVTLDIPVSAFVGFASINTDLDGFFECLEIADNPDRLENLQDDITGRLEDQRNRVADTGEQILDDFIRNFDGDRFELAQELSDLSIEDLRDGDLEDLFSDVSVFRADRVIDRVVERSESLEDQSPDTLLTTDVNTRGGAPQAVETAAQNAVVSVLRPIELISEEIDDFEDAVAEEFDEGSDCFNEFIGTAETARSELRGIVEQIEAATTFEGIDTPEIPGPDLPDLDCSDVSNRIRNLVEEVEQESNRLQDLSPFEIDNRLLNRVRDDAEQARQLIREEVDSRNPCQDQLEARVDEAQNILDQIDAIDPSELPCSDQFPEAESAIREFEEFVEQPRSILEDVGQGGLEDRVQDARDTVDEVAEGECLIEMNNRLDRLFERAVSRADGLRIREGLLGRAEQRRQEIVEGIEDATEGIDGDFEIPDIGGDIEDDLDFEDPQIDIPDIEDIDADIDG